MRYLAVKKYEEFQHYKHRTPPWIKLYTRLLSDYDFGCLQDASKLHLIMIWLLASRLDNCVPWDENWIRKQTGLNDAIDLQVLVDKGFLYICKQDASTVLAERKQDALPETETETEAEVVQVHLESPVEPATAIVHVEGNGKALRAQARGATAIQVRDRLADYMASVHDKALTRRDVERLQIETCFTYWAMKHGHPQSLLDPKREGLIRRRLNENGGNLSELLYVIDGALRDAWLVEHKYDGLQTLFRDRAQIERLAGLVPRYGTGELHPMAAKVFPPETPTET